MNQIDKEAAYLAIKHEAETHEFPASKEAYERAARIIDQMHPCEARWDEYGDCSYCRAHDYSGQGDFCWHCGCKMINGGKCRNENI